MTLEMLDTAPSRLPWRRLSDGLKKARRIAARHRAEGLTRVHLAAIDDHLLRDIGLRRDQIGEASRAAARALPR